MISSGFIRARIRPSWRDMKFGFEKGLVDSQALIDLAANQVAELDQPSGALLELAGSGRADDVGDLVDKLAENDAAQAEDDVRNKWLYLVLAWLYERRETVSDALRAVEEVYAEFGYPQHIAHFVRYMPADEPNLGSREANEQRLLERWKQYLEATGRGYER